MAGDALTTAPFSFSAGGDRYIQIVVDGGYAFRCYVQSVAY